MSNPKPPTVMTTPKDIRQVLGRALNPKVKKEIVAARAIAVLRTMGKSEEQAKEILGL